MTERTRTFTPDWVSPPGDTIADCDWTQVRYEAEMVQAKASFLPACTSNFDRPAVIYTSVSGNTKV